MCHFALLTNNGSNTWKTLTLDSLKKSTTTCRDVRYLVCETELVYTSYRVTTTDEGECTLSSSLSHSLTYSA